jgi:hypothetical protein
MKGLFPVGVALLLLLAVVGCGSSPSYAQYTDSRYHFSFRYPSDWQAPKKGHYGQSDGVPSYLVDFNNPDVGFRVVVNRLRPDYSSVSNGEVISHQTGCPQICIYYRITISHRPGILVAWKIPGHNIDHEYAFVNSPRWGYDIEIANPNGLTKEQQKQFAHVLATFKIAPGE